jgi:hypothetical protein
MIRLLLSFDHKTGSIFSLSKTGPFTTSDSGPNVPISKVYLPHREEKNQECVREVSIVAVLADLWGGGEAKTSFFISRPKKRLKKCTVTALFKRRIGETTTF